MTRALATSPDGQWAATLDGRELMLFTADPGPPVAKMQVDTDDVDVALVGPPTSLVIITRHEGRGRVQLAAPPSLDIAARLDLETPARLVAVTGPRLALLSPDNKHLYVVRTAARALGVQKLDVTGPIEFVVGLERNQLLLGLLKKLEVWDAVSGRPLLRPQFQLPPPPRRLGAASGHVWAMLEGSDEIFVYRLSDGRPFRHYVGSSITEVISSPSSPILVLVTTKGLVRLHCFAQSITLIDGVPEPYGALAQLASGEDISVLGFTGEGGPWRIAINGAGAVGSSDAPAEAPRAALKPPPRSEASRNHPARAKYDQARDPARLDLSRSEAKVSTLAENTTWRETLATYGADVIKGGDPEMPSIGADTEVGELIEHFKLGNAARRALVALYALHLNGDRGFAIARLAKLAGDWPEALGQGELGSLAMLRRKHGRVGLRTAVTDLLDGMPARHIRLAGEVAAPPRPGAFRVARDGRSDAEIELALTAQLGRIAIVESAADRAGDRAIESALLEAHLRNATAVTFSIPSLRPTRWPRGAGLVLVLYGTASSWVADVPALPAPTAPAEA